MYKCKKVETSLRAGAQETCEVSTFAQVRSSDYAALKGEEELPTVSTHRTRIKFFSFDEINRLAVVECSSDSVSGPNSVGDCRLGTLEHDQLCQTCYKSPELCPGHIGKITLNDCMPNPMAIKFIIWCLTAVCNNCGYLLVPLDVIRKKGFLHYHDAQRLQKIAEEALMNRYSCGRQGFEQCPPNDKYKTSDNTVNNPINITRDSKDEASPVSVERILEIFRSISKPHLEAMGFIQTNPEPSVVRYFIPSNPSDFIIRALPVIPPCARVYTHRDGQVYQDHLTESYMSIIRCNNKIAQMRKAQADGANNENEIADTITGMRFAISHLMDNTDGCGKKGNSEKMKSIRQRISGKGEAIRGYAMGKRNDFTARTVIGPDSRIPFGFVSVPDRMRSVLTTPITIADYNINYVRELYRKGEVTHFIPRDGKAKFGRIQINDATRAKYADMLAVGDKVAAWAQDGDEIIANRQPTLHKQALMAYRAKWRKLERGGLHSTSTIPHNADFDGDEFNFHKLQTLDARAECRGAMSVNQNVMNAQESSPIIGLVYNSVSSAYMLTYQGDGPVEAWDQLTADILPYPDFPERCAKHKLVKRGRFALFSILLPSDFYYDSGSQDTGVKIRDGCLLRGTLTKSHIGPVSSSIVHYLWKMYGKDVVAKFLTEGQWLLDRYIERVGLSISYSDCAGDAAKVKNEVEFERRKALLQVRNVPPGKSAIEKQQYEVKVQNILNNIAAVGKKLSKDLAPNNPLNIMSNSKAKGKTENIAQILGLLGQQFVQGLRPALDLGPSNDRCLPYFEVGSTDIAARGFITESFNEGLEPAGLVFHMEASRVGLLNTAIATSQTGSMHHKLNKATEDIIATYAGSICNTSGVIFRPVYDDGFDSAELIRTTSKATGDFFSFVDIPYVVNKLNNEAAQA